MWKANTWGKLPSGIEGIRVGVEVKLHDKTTLITNCQQRNVRVSEYVSDRSGRGLKHIEPERTPVY